MERIVAIVTPKEKNRWTNEYLVSLTDLERLISYLGIYGFHDILFLGYTGEYNRLSLDEAKTIIEFAEEYKCKIKKKGNVVINISRDTKEEVFELMKLSEFCDYFMISKNNLSNNGFFEIINKCKKPVIYYLKKDENELLYYLLNEEKIIGIKDSLKGKYEERKKKIESYGKIYYFGDDLNFLKEKKGNIISGTIQLFPQLWKEEKYDLIEKIVEKIEEKKKDVDFPKICKYMLSFSPPFVPLIKGDDLDEETIKKLEEIKDFYIELKRKYKF